MTNQEIIEGNRLIAEFMGKKFLNQQEYAKETGCPEEEIIYMPICNCFYHSDWNEIMPVVEKIESIKDDYHGKFQIFINSNQCIIQSINIFKKRKNDYYFNEYTLGSKIESTYMAVVKFIEWYNKQTKHE